MIKDIGTKIAEGIEKFYEAFQSQRVLKTMEEVEANTNEENIPSALLLSELNNKLGGFEPVINSNGKITGYKTDIGGADTVFPFFNSVSFTVHWYVQLYVDGVAFNHTTGTIRLKVTKDSVTVVSGSWPYMQNHYSTGKNFYTSTSIQGYSDFVVE